MEVEGDKESEIISHKMVYHERHMDCERIS